MSVICQNFVQNAWKKDLCSNCFKSFGDHNDVIKSPDSSTEEKMEHQESCRNARYTPQATTIYQSRNGMTSSHTTWKSLITEKNCRNSQPFKLESGFKGRLLTINNVFEKNSKIICATEHEKSCESHDKPVNGLPLTSNSSETEENVQSVLSTTHSELEPSNGKVIHGILKKSALISSPRGHTRRSSNVGFKEEEPLVIGYGGRDFSPEELEWEMTLDGEGGSTSDSLDETEEDKAISKITKQNTEFNSNNKNLLRENGSHRSKMKCTNGITNGKPGENPDSDELSSQKVNGENAVTSPKHGNKVVALKSAVKNKSACSENENINFESKNKEMDCEGIKKLSEGLNNTKNNLDSSARDAKLVLNNIKNNVFVNGGKDKNVSLEQNGKCNKRLCYESNTDAKNDINLCNVQNGKCADASSVNLKKIPLNGLSKSALCTKQNLTHFVNNTSSTTRNHGESCHLVERMNPDPSSAAENDVRKDTAKKPNAGRQKNKLDALEKKSIKETSSAANDDETEGNDFPKLPTVDYSDPNERKEKKRVKKEFHGTQEDKIHKGDDPKKTNLSHIKGDRSSCEKEKNNCDIIEEEELTEALPPGLGVSAKNENIAPVEQCANVEDRGLPSVCRNSNVVFPSERAQWEEVQQQASAPYKHPFAAESAWDGETINQAINTSLTRGITDDGHLINNSCEPSMTSLDNGDSSGTPISTHAPNYETEENPAGVTSPTKRPSSMGENAAISSSGNQDVDESVFAEMLVNETSVKPRASFLHGICSDYEESAVSPNAVYSPAGDLFVTRRSSSSSSSSDENRKSQISVTCNTESTETLSDATPSILQDEENVLATETEKDCESSCKARSSLKMKPQIPAKPPPINKPPEEAQYATPLGKSENIVESVYYSVANSASNSKVPPISHYAESNIYQEVTGAATRSSPDGTKDLDEVRESKLAALAMELEQARCSNGNTKRQAPAPPRVPDPPSEEPPSCFNRAQTESPRASHINRSDSVPFSSSSSTTSSSSQDTDTGFTASWNINSDIFTSANSSSKSKGSFLLNQYSKCKMLALGYSEDGAKTRKKFSLKKLLKIGKESDSPITFDPNYPNPKAWKYSENFDRPRAKLEIIHPMDLEKNIVTINPGFEPVRLTSSGSIGSLTSSFDSYSIRTSMSSDYGNLGPDSLRSQSSLDSKSTSSYDCGLSSDSGACISNASATNGQTFSRQLSQTPSNSKSPTPSRSSLSSQASTITSMCSRNGIPARPPKPPPPPRAHSLLPGNRNFKPINDNTAFKYSDQSTVTSKGSDASESLPPKPQVPKRQFRPSMKSEYANLESRNNGSPVVSESTINYLQCQETEKQSSKNSCHENMYECIRTFSVDSEEIEDAQYQDVALPKDATSECETLEASQAPLTDSQSTPSVKEMVQSVSNSGTKLDGDKSKPLETCESNYSVASKQSKTISGIEDGANHSTFTQNKNSPLTKAPSRPPPIYTKSQHVVGNKYKPWNVLENSYAALSSNNREMLIKLIDYGTRKRPNLQEMKMSSLKWEDFTLDAKRPAVVYAFGDKIVYDATLSDNSDFQVTLVISTQSLGYNSSSQLKYPVLGHFSTNLPNDILQVDIQENPLEIVSASVCVIYRAEVITIENFIEDLPEVKTDELDRELCFILLQLIKGLKILQAQGIESIDASFQNLILCKTEFDNLHTLVFLSDNFFEDASNMYTSVSENSKISLCQYALMLLLQFIKVENSEQLLFSEKLGNLRKSSKIFISAVNLLKEEKAVSLSQVKTLLECYIWGVQTVLQEINSCDYDSVLQRWMDIERSNFLKSVISKSQRLHLNTEEEFYSDFFVKTNIRSIKDVIEFI